MQLIARECSLPALHPFAWHSVTNHPDGIDMAIAMDERRIIERHALGGAPASDAVAGGAVALARLKQPLALGQHCWISGQRN